MMPSNKISISECNVSDLRLRPFNLIWGGPLLVVDRKRRQKRQDQESKVQPPPPVPEVTPAVVEVKPEAAPPDEPMLPAEPENPPTDNKQTEKEKRTKPVKPKKRKRIRQRRYYDSESDSESDSDGDSDNDSDRSSMGLHQDDYRYSYHCYSRPRNRHGGCLCTHDTKSGRNRPKHKRQSKYESTEAVRCLVCRQYMGLSTIEGEGASSNSNSDAERSHTRKRDKRNKRPKRKRKAGKKESGTGVEEQETKDGNINEDGTREPSAPTAPTDGEAVTVPVGQGGTDGDSADKNAGGIDGETVNVESNVISTIQDAVHALPSADLCADISAQSDACPPSSKPSCHRYDHDILQRQSDFARMPCYRYPHPPYPAYPYASTYPVYPYPHMAPPVAGCFQPHMLSSVSPYPSTAAHATFEADIQEDGGKTAVGGESVQNDSTYNLASWHDMAASASGNTNRGFDGDKAAGFSNEQIDSWGIKWDHDVGNKGIGGGTCNDEWGCEPAITECTGDHDQPVAWTTSDLALLGRLHAQHVTDRWRDLQTAFYNETGRMVDWEVLKSRAEEAANRR